MSFSTGGFNNFNQRIQLHAVAGVALRNFFSAYGQAIVTDAKKIAPRFEGKLRGSLTFKHAGVDVTGIPIGIDVYSRSPYALYVHGFYDQKFKLKEPWSRSKPHYPPIKAITKWSRAKGLNPYAVQHAIGQRGTPIIPFFKIAINNNEAQRKLLLKKTGVQIQAKWTAGRLIR